MGKHLRTLVKPISAALLAPALLLPILSGCNTVAGRLASLGLPVPIREDMGIEDAKQLVLQDAGIDEADATFTSEKTEGEDGEKTICLKFYTADAEYQYEIRAAEGSIYSKEIEHFPQGPQTEQRAGSAEEASAQPVSGDAGDDAGSGAGPSGPQDDGEKESGPDVPPDMEEKSDEAPEPAAEEESPPPQGGSVGVDGAKRIALRDAGVHEADAVFTEEKVDYENAQKIYALEFHTADSEYEYEIKASDGSVYSKEMERLHENPGIQPPGASAPVEKPNASLDDAKRAALNDAGVAASNAVFTSERLDYEDGVQVYDLAFYTPSAEYEYEIGASDCSILSRAYEPRGQ